MHTLAPALQSCQKRSQRQACTPKGTSKEIIGKLATALDKALDDRALKKRIADLGGSLPSKQERQPAKFEAFIKAEIARWSPILKSTSTNAN